MVKLTAIILSIATISTIQPSTSAIPFLGTAVHFIHLGEFAKEVFEAFLGEENPLEEVSKKIDEMNAEVNRNIQNVISKIDDIPSIIDLLDDRKKLREKTNRIGRIFKELALTKKRIDLGEFNDHDADHSHTWNLHERDLKDDMSEIRRIMLDSNVTSYLTANFQTKLEKYENVCNTRMSHLQLLDNLLNTFKTATVQYYIARRSIYEFLEFEAGEDRTKDKEFLDRDVLRDYKQDITNFKNIMTIASRDFWTCDSVNSKESSYEELRLYSKYMVLSDSLPEEYMKCADTKCDRGRMNPYQYKKCVTVNCPNVTKVEKCSDLDKLCEQTRSCPNELRDCKRMHPTPTRYPFISESTNVCANKDKTAINRYKSIVSEANEKDFSCHDGEHHRLNTWNTDSPFHHTEHYVYECDCAENEYYLNRIPEVVSEGFALTGARLKVHEKTIYIQIQEGKLLPNGLINETSIRWRPITYVKEDFQRIKISLTEHRSFDLTEASLPDNRVITGLGFGLRDNHRVYLDVLSSEFDFSTGKFNYRPTHYLQESSKQGSNEINLTNSDVPTKAKEPNTPYSKDNDFVTFKTSSLEKDGGQTIIPFIDTQKVESNYPAPLSAASLYIRGQEGYGGFLGLKFKTYNFVPHIKIDTELSLDFTFKA